MSLFFCRRARRSAAPWVNVAALRLLGFEFPYDTLTVNVVSSLVTGLLVSWFALKINPVQRWQLFFTTGVLGGFTTFSTFSFEVALRYERGAIGMAVIYVVASVSGAVFRPAHSPTFRVKIYGARLDE
jgi:CrcB protein